MATKGRRTKWFLTGGVVLVGAIVALIVLLAQAANAETAGVCGPFTATGSASALLSTYSGGLSQSFIPPDTYGNGNFTTAAIDVPIIKSATGTNRNVTLHLAAADINGLPIGDITSVTRNTSVMNTGYFTYGCSVTSNFSVAAQRWTFSSPVSLIPNGHYAFYFTEDGTGTKDINILETSANPYPDGVFAYNCGAGWITFHGPGCAQPPGDGYDIDSFIVWQQDNDRMIATPTPEPTIDIETDCYNPGESDADSGITFSFYGDGTTSEFSQGFEVPAGPNMPLEMVETDLSTAFISPTHSTVRLGVYAADTDYLPTGPEIIGLNRFEDATNFPIHDILRPCGTTLNYPNSGSGGSSDTDGYIYFWDLTDAPVSLAPGKYAFVITVDTSSGGDVFWQGTGFAGNQRVGYNDPMNGWVVFDQYAEGGQEMNYRLWGDVGAAPTPTPTPGRPCGWYCVGGD